MTLALLRRPGPLRLTAPAAWALVAATVLAQVLYPLSHGGLRDRLTITVVLLAALAAAVHALTTRGRRGLAAVAAAAGLGLGAELVGVHTGVPFGDYAYTGTLGVQVSGVPLLVAAAWLMMAWPAALAARTLTADPRARVVVGAWALAAWDLFLDPQMVSERHWTWAPGGPHLPGVPDIPLSNFGGWLLVALVVSAAVQAVLGADDRPDDAPAVGFYLWTYASSVLATAAFWHRPGAAAWGALVMGVVAVPLARRVRSGAPRSPRWTAARTAGRRSRGRA